jgi:RsiW-degrading membrane proteinase PrsW (M82 family)
VDLLSYLVIAILIGVSPAIFFLWFFYRRDKWEREPRRLVLTIFLFGLVPAIIVAVVLEEIVGIFITSAAFGAVIAAPIIEEVTLWGVVRWRAYNRKEFNEPLDGLVYGAAAALGFAALENVLYLLPYGGFTSAFLGEALIRGLFSVPGHALFTGTSCFFLGGAKFMPKGLRRYAVMFGGLVLAMVLHATWNSIPTFVAPFGDAAGLLAMIVFAAIAWLLVANWINVGLNRSPFNPTRRKPLPSAVLGARVSKVIPPADFTAPPRTQGAARSAEARFCPRCGAPLGATARFCPECGTPIRTETGQ